MIPFNRAAVLAALVLLVACQLYGSLASASSSVRVLDESDPLDIEAIARAMCESKAKRDGQISRLSTVDKLVEFFDQQVSGESHELFKCKQLHSETLRQLQEALNASKENVCSAKKLALIEDFHNQFVSRLVEHKKNRKEEHRQAAPHLLRLFFMHYAMEVDAVCRRNLVKNVEFDLKEKLGDDIDDKLFELKDQSSDSEGRAPLSAVFKSSMQKFTDLNPVEKCEDVLLFWDLIENSYTSKKQAKDEVTIEDDLDPQTGEPIRMMLKLRSRGSLNAIKDHCHYNLKPIYSKLVLPIIKLADLGYSNNGGQSKEQMKTSEEVKRWISATQMCEALLPIKYYEDPSLGPKDVVVISKREAARLDGATGEQSAGESKVPLVYEPETNSMEGLDRIESVATVDPKRLVKSVKSNVKARRHIIGRIVIRLVRKLKSSLMKSLTGHIFFLKSTEPNRIAHPKSSARDEQAAEGEKEDVSQELSKSLESMSDEDIEKLEDDAPSRMLRTSSKSGGLMGKLRRHAPTKRLSDLVLRKDPEKKPGPAVMYICFGILAVVVVVAGIFTVMG